jgi:hypothetical protein
MEKNGSLKTMDRINRVIDWMKVEERLRNYYEIGRREEEADAYPPLMLLKAFLLQKWFQFHPNTGAKRALFTTIFKNLIAATFRQMAFNLFRGSKIISDT